MDHRGDFDELEARALDLSSMFAAAFDVTPLLRLFSRNTDVIIVLIDDNYSEDKRLFGNPPLQPSTLIQLVTAIANAKPRVIGVDIVKDPAIWSQVPHTELPIVWAYRPWDPEGILPPPRGDAWNGWGVPKFPPHGPVLRQYSRLVPCNEEEGKPQSVHNVPPEAPQSFCRAVAACKDNYCPSLAWELIKKRDPRTGLQGSSEELTIRFVRAQNIVHASSVLRMASSPSWSQPGSILWNKTVLLGRTSGDEHETPVGRISGVQIWANILETEIEGGGYRSPQWFVLLFLGLSESVLLIWLLQVWNFKRGLLFSTIAVPFLSVVLSYIVYHSARRWAYFAMILVTLILQQCWEMVREQRYEQVKELIGAVKSSVIPRHSGNNAKRS